MNTTLRLADLISERVKGLQEYAPEPLEEVALRLNLPVGQMIKLDANENPYGPTRHTLNVLNGYSNYHHYPDAVSRRLRQAIGHYINMDPAQIIVGNGSDELIDLIVRIFRPGPSGGGIAQMIDCPPTFGMYQFYGTTNDLQVITIPRMADFAVDVERIEALCDQDPQPRILFLASPNNPDGGVLPDDYIIRLLNLPLLVILDEAYVEFGGGSRVQWVPERENLIVLRTFSKWAGLAGLRVGYGVFPECLMTALWRMKSPYNVNCAAQVAALATLESIDEARATIQKIITERQRLLNKLREISFLEVYDSRANYILCRTRGLPAAAVREAMEQRGIMLRYFQGPGLENCIRITVGTPMQDEAALIVLRNLDRKGDNHEH